jgi:hypothetical protein
MPADAARRLAPPLLLSGLLLAASPFLGWLRDRLLDLFPLRFVQALAAGFALAVGAVLVGAAWRIRERRLWRWGGLALAALLVAAQVGLFATGNARVDAVERVHVLLYGAAAALWYRALLPAGGRGALPQAWLATALVGLADEWVQWLVPLRIGDVRDVGLNLGAAATGLVFAASLWPPAAASAPPARARRRLALLAAAALLAFAAFFHCAHLGYEIEDTAIGRFRSYFSRERLLALRDRRTGEWARRPLGPPPLLGVEDFFRTEAGWHVQHRNVSRERGDAFHAWKENLILETYYTPFLDTAPPRREGSFRLTPEERADLERRRPRRDPVPYASPALRERIVVRPSKPVFWALVAGGAALALMLGYCSRGAPKSSTQ